MQTEDRLRPEDLTDREALAQAESLIRQVQRHLENKRSGTLVEQSNIDNDVRKCKDLRAKVLELYART